MELDWFHHEVILLPEMKSLLLMHLKKLSDVGQVPGAQSLDSAIKSVFH